jgi:hypothetical protein
MISIVRHRVELIKGRIVFCKACGTLPKKICQGRSDTVSMAPGLEVEKSSTRLIRIVLCATPTLQNPKPILHLAIPNIRTLSRTFLKRDVVVVGNEELLTRRTLGTARFNLQTIPILAL